MGFVPQQLDGLGFGGRGRRRKKSSISSLVRAAKRKLPTSDKKSVFSRLGVKRAKLIKKEFVLAKEMAREKLIRRDMTVNSALPADIPITPTEVVETLQPPETVMPGATANGIPIAQSGNIQAGAMPNFLDLAKLTDNPILKYGLIGLGVYIAFNTFNKVR